MPPRTILACSLLLLAGCLHTRNGRPEQTSGRYVQARGPREAAAPVRWRQILIGGGAKQQHVGYLRSDAVSEGTDPHQVHTVYDTDFVVVGRVGTNGYTSRVDDLGREVELGFFSLEQSMLSIWRRADNDPVVFARMPDPR